MYKLLYGGVIAPVRGTGIRKPNEPNNAQNTLAVQFIHESPVRMNRLGREH